MTGLNPSQIPRRDPAKAAWAIHTPMKDNRMVTTKTPTVEQARAPSSPAIKAFCIKLYPRMDRPILPPAVKR
jgi:hypothetical protein